MPCQHPCSGKWVSRAYSLELQFLPPCSAVGVLPRKEINSIKYPMGEKNKQNKQTNTKTTTKKKRDIRNISFSFFHFLPFPLFPYLSFLLSVLA